MQDGYGFQEFFAVAEGDSDLFQIRVVQVRQYFHVDSILGKPVGVFAQTDLVQPVVEIIPHGCRRTRLSLICSCVKSGNWKDGNTRWRPRAIDDLAPAHRRLGLVN